MACLQSVSQSRNQLHLSSIPLVLQLILTPQPTPCRELLLQELDECLRRQGHVRDKAVLLVGKPDGPVAEVEWLLVEVPH